MTRYSIKYSVATFRISEGSLNAALRKTMAPVTAHVYVPHFIRTCAASKARKRLRKKMYRRFYQKEPFVVREKLIFSNGNTSHDMVTVWGMSHINVIIC